MTIRALEFYGGIGGLHKALELSDVDATIVRAFDWDQTARRVYEANYGFGLVEKVDISKLTATDLVTLNASLWLLSPSCQPYTVLNPVAKGAYDPRAKSFLHLVQDVIPDLTSKGCGPRWILVENVAGFETSSTRLILVESLRKCDYAIFETLLTPLQFGIPNSRLRYYLLAKRRPLSFANVSSQHEGLDVIWRHIPGHGEPWEDNRVECTAAELRAYLDPEPINDEDHSGRIPERVLMKWGRLFDIVLPSSRRSCCFTRGYTQLVERAGSILQMNEDLDTTRTFDTFLALQKQAALDETESQHPSWNCNSLKVLEPLRLRYFSPSELLRLFHFESPGPGQASAPGSKARTFVWPPDVSRKSRYRLLGNSLNVEVVRLLINYLLEGDNDISA